MAKKEPLILEQIRLQSESVIDVERRCMDIMSRINASRDHNHLMPRYNELSNSLKVAYKQIRALRMTCLDQKLSSLDDETFYKVFNAFKKALSIESDIPATSSELIAQSLKLKGKAIPTLIDLANQYVDDGFPLKQSYIDKDLHLDNETRRRELEWIIRGLKRIIPTK